MPMLCLVLGLFVFNLGFLIFTWPFPIGRYGCSAWINLVVVTLMALQNVTFFWLREGRISVVMRVVTYLFTVGATLVILLALANMAHHNPGI